MQNTVNKLFKICVRFVSVIGLWCLINHINGVIIQDQSSYTQYTFNNNMTTTAQAYTVPWPLTETHYYFKNFSVQDLFQYMSEDLQKKIIVSNMLAGSLNLDLPNSYMKEVFLQVLTDLNAIFYFDGDAIYLYHRNETQQMSIKLTQITVSDFVSKLKQLSVYDPKFVWQKLDNHNLNIFGPPRYLQIIRDIIHKVDAPRKIVVKYFPLNYAMAADKKIEVRGETVVVEGVETILKALIHSKDDNTASKNSYRALLDESKLQQNLHNLSGAYIGQITHDNRRNAIIVKDYIENMDAYANLIAMLDKPMPMIEIAVSIVDVDVNYNQTLGINWNVDIQGQDINTEQKEVQDSETSLMSNLARMFKGSILSNVQATSILSRIKLMENKGSGRVISRPSVLAKNNTQATLDYTNTFFIPTRDKESKSTEQIVTGVLLKVTPRVSINDQGERIIHLDIAIEDSNINSQGMIYSGFPRISKTSINTSATLQEGTSFVIGGYYNEIGAKSVDQVPLIHKIPILGEFFKMRNRNLRKFERIFFIVPSIVNSTNLE